MKHTFLALCSVALFISCSSKKKNNSDKGKSELTISNDYANIDAMKYAKTITLEELKEQLYFYASDEMEGRNTGSPGQKKAVKYIRSKYETMNVPGGNTDGTYFQSVPGTYFNKPELSSENVLAFIKGTEKPEEVLVISAHLDHVGMEDDEVFNGADDDGSGTIALIEIAEAFKHAADEGYGPKRSILFLHVTGEEIGLYGSKYYSENPVYAMENTIANLNIDMIGRIDPERESKSDYIYLIGSDMLSQDLHDISEMANEKYIKLDLDYKYNGKDDPNRFYYRSDHYNFAKNDVPVIFYFNGTHEDYHKASDTADKIEYKLYQKRTQLVFVTAWELANGINRPQLN
ncbi:M28 family metallopeptidase [Nonlabens sp.]|uniref:M28 family metallopeptidase n=1 Tax=Nonlabens sp. TaxID=1888209 RepID=UPI003F695CEB